MAARQKMESRPQIISRSGIQRTNMAGPDIERRGKQARNGPEKELRGKRFAQTLGKLAHGKEQSTMFTIIKQLHPGAGCIPACAASVMQFHHIRGNWTEDCILDMYLQQKDSGFATLKSFLDRVGLPDGWTVQIGDANANFKQFVVDKNSGAVPLLCPISQGEGNSAHCVVLAESDADNLRIFDPAQGVPDMRIERYDDFVSRWAGSFLWFERST